MLRIGRIYKTKREGHLYRIFQEGRYARGRGCTKSTATPNNYLKEEDMFPATIDEINTFLEEEMRSGMAQTINK
jgi:hypothetical protein